MTVAAIPILFAITFHEVAHGWVADKLGDPTARSMGRLSFNPLAHIDPVNTVILPIVLFIVSNGMFIFGSAKPVPVDYRNLKNPRRDSAIVSAAGPVMNIILAIVSLLILVLLYNVLPHMDSDLISSKVMPPVLQMLQYGVSFNIFIAAFNLIPIPPLDGGRIAVSMLPPRQAYAYSRLEPYGIYIVLILWMTGLARIIIYPIQAFIKFLISLFMLPFGGLM
ncbi:site-2 protease family protein [Candidatus Magnetominusculus xianensis]|uniref:site-2 protease family protein n=1 Tax=Candidatus Magnetominusculus xianensis TaxID=1748249 RepID=UPI001F3E4AAD|nr:site-2 protease family protein [Candidatus Magnetominusculus xianensis]